MQSSVEQYNVASEFSPFPAGRNVSDGPYSGEGFRNGVLVPIIVSKKRTALILDEVEGFGSSFLEEAFGGLIRECNFSSDDIEAYIEMRTTDELLLEEIRQYIKDAQAIARQS